jgi:hypothetical protein
MILISLSRISGGKIFFKQSFILLLLGQGWTYFHSCPVAGIIKFQSLFKEAQGIFMITGIMIIGGEVKVNNPSIEGMGV